MEWYLCCVFFMIGIFKEIKRQREFDKGIIKGFPESKNIVDYLFFNYHE